MIAFPNETAVSNFVTVLTVKLLYSNTYNLRLQAYFVNFSPNINESCCLIN